MKPEDKDPLAVKRSDGNVVDLSNLWSPCPGFLVCAGPSVNDVAIERLKDRGIVSLAVNQVAAKVPVRAWCYSDNHIKFHHGLYLDPAIMSFVPNPKMWRKIAVRRDRQTGWEPTWVRIGSCPNTFGYDRNTCFVPETFYETTYAHWGPKGKQPQDRPFEGGALCTMLIGLRLLNYLGVKRIYLLGVDFEGRDGKCYGFESKKGARTKRYQWEENMLKSLVPYMEKKGIEVYNCNPLSRCRTFSYVPFGTAIKDCRGDVPEEPLDTYDWYETSVINEDCKKNKHTKVRHFQS